MQIMQKTGRVGNLEVDFQQVPTIHLFWKFHSIVVKDQLFKLSKEQ